MSEIGRADGLREDNVLLVFKDTVRKAIEKPAIISLLDPFHEQ
jgi:hypothetical protein